MASRIRRLLFAALLVASAVGVLVAIHFDRARKLTTQQTFVAPSAMVVAPAPSVERVVQLRGHILNANGDAINGAHVRVTSAEHVVAEVATDAAGQFSFDRLANGSVRVEADHDPEGAVRSAEISISNVATDLVLVLVPASVHGVVVDGESGHPIAGASLSMDGVPFLAPGTTSDASGEFRFAVVPFEATAIVGVASGYRTARVPLAPRENLSEPALRIVLRAAPPIDGDVVDQDGKPLHAQIVACEGQPFEVHVESSDDGAFQLPPSAVGCDAFATHADMAPSDAAQIVEGRHTTLRLGAAGSIAGFAIDERGRSIDSFSVGIESFVPARGLTPPRGGASDFKDGSFRLERLVPGTYVLTAATSGRPPARSSSIVVRSGAVTDNVKIVIAQGGAVEGHVFDDHHAPIADAELHFDLVSSVIGSDAIATTNASGYYRLEAAPAGLFTVSARKEGYRVKLVSGMTVSAGQTITKDLTLAKGSGFELSGIGANLSQVGNGIGFAGVLPGDPADGVGLHPGDRILRIDGEEIAGLSVEDAIQRLRGEPGTVVGITVERGGETLDVAITRATLVH
ncbi:MAG: carboxypeptidase regulatory-like domain-containing protein [Polyangiaceae bacterium]